MRPFARSQALAASTRPVLEGLEGRQLFAGQNPLGINLNDLASSRDADFTAATAELKNLGVTAVRLFYTTNMGDTPSSTDKTLQRVFQLKDQGFNVLLLVTPNTTENGGTFVAPTDASTRSEFTKLLAYQRSGNPSQTLGSAVDRWEIGNEVNLDTYYHETYTDSSGTHPVSDQTRVQDYVKNMLMPAAQVLKQAGKTVVSSGLTYGASDAAGGPLRTELAAIKAYGVTNPFSYIDYIGYHPYNSIYGMHSTVQGVRTAIDDPQYGSAGKPALATEWGTDNPAGNSTYTDTPANDQTWANNNDSAYRNDIRAGFDTAYYFATLDRNPWNSGKQVHSIQSPLTHTDTNGDGIPDSNGVITRKSPFYEMMIGWKSIGDPTNPSGNATISGTYFGDSNGNGVKDGTETGQSGKTMFIDANNDGVLDNNEATAVTDASGVYTFNVTVSGSGTNSFVIRRDGLPAGYRLTGAYTQNSVTVAAGDNKTGVDFGTTSLVLIQGTVTNDATNAGVAGQTVYVDTNNDGTPEATATTDSNGAYSIGSLAAGTYTVRLTPTGSYAQSTPAGSGGVTVTPANPNAAVANFAVHSTVVPTTGTITGVYWGDSNANSVKDAGESPQSGKVMYLDANNNGVLDTGEATSTTDVNGAYSFANLAVGQTYRVRRSGLPAGFRFTTPASGFYDVSLTSASPTASNEDFLVTDKASITGTYFGDSNSNGVLDNGETGQSGKVMYLDANNNGVLDSGEVTSTTDANGLYRFDGLAVNSGTTYHVRRSGLPAGYRLTTPASGVIDLVLTDVESYDSNDFGVTYA